MNTRFPLAVGVTVLGLAIATLPGVSQTRRSTFSENHHNLNVNFNGTTGTCADVQVSSNGKVAQSVERFSMQRNEVPVLEMDAATNGVIQVTGWDRSDFAVEACKLVAADDQATADSMARGISVNRMAGRFTVNGPQTNDGNWEVYFLVRAPRDASLDLQTMNGPISVRDIKGVVKVKAANGPVSLSNAEGRVEADTANGPISYSGGGGDVHLTAHNGPISLKVSGDLWNGPKLEARSINGPLSLALSPTFRSGLRIESGKHAPMSCSAEFCRNAYTDATSDQRTLQMNGSADTIRVITQNGPISVKATGPKAF